MKLTRIHTRIVDHPLFSHRIVISPAGRHSQSRFVTITVEDADGVKGYGESATTAIWSGETAETAKVLIDTLLAPALLGATLEHPAEALAIIDSKLWGAPFTKAGLDVAIWDLWAKRQGKPVAQLIADRPLPSTIPTRVSIGAYHVEKTVALAHEFYACGIRTLKFKVGLPGIDDVGRLRAVREALGTQVKFTIDYNGAFQDANAALRHLDSLAPFEVEYAEQPTHRDRISLMAAVRKESPMLILADEAIFMPGHLEEAIDLDAFDLLSLYPGKNGGFTRSLEMAALARKNQKPCAIGSNLETDLGLAASATLAASLTAFPVTQLSSDFASSLFYQTHAITVPLHLQDGAIQLPTGCGFGVLPCTA